MNEGKLPKPKRTINFQWGAEISGTNAWLNAHPEKEKVIIGDLNFDMEGIRIALSRSYWILQRTPDTFPSYINDIAQGMMEWVSDVAGSTSGTAPTATRQARSRWRRRAARTRSTSRSTSTTGRAIT